MKDDLIPIDRLKNVGPKIARRLREIGIRTRGELSAVGVVTAYRRICEKHAGATIPVCYYLYSLEGALRDLHWNALPAQVKRELVRRAKPIEEATRLRAPKIRGVQGV